MADVPEHFTFDGEDGKVVIPPEYRDVLRRAYTMDLRQTGWELVGLLDELKKISPKVIVEIGIWKGATSYVWTTVFPDAMVIGMDINVPDLSAKEGFERVIHLEANSHETATHTRLVELLGDRKIDFLFIDGDHSYKGTKIDFEMYNGLVRPGGVIAFHDICVVQPNPTIRCREAWLEVMNKYRHREIMDPAVPYCGIGVLYNEPKEHIKVLVVSPVGQADSRCMESWMRLDHTPIEYLLSRTGEIRGCNNVMDRTNYHLKVEAITRARNEILNTAMKLEWDYLLWLDSDVEINPDTLSRLLKYVPKEKVITAVVPYRQGNSVVDFKDKNGYTQWVGWHCILVSREVHERVGKFVCPPRMDVGEDIEYCKMAGALGYKIFVAEEVTVKHHFR